MKKVFDEYFKRLVSFCTGIIKNKQDAEDIAMNAFIELYKRYDAFETEHKMKAFLFLSAKRRCINYMRDSRKTISCDITDELIDCAEINATLMDELNEFVSQQLPKLPWRQRQIAEMIMSGLTEAEIAERLNVSKKSISNLKAVMVSTLKPRFKRYLKISL